MKPETGNQALIDNDNYIRQMLSIRRLAAPLLPLALAFGLSGAPARGDTVDPTAPTQLGTDLSCMDSALRTTGPDISMPLHHIQGQTTISANATSTEVIDGTGEPCTDGTRSTRIRELKMNGKGKYVPNSVWVTLIANSNDAVSQKQFTIYLQHPSGLVKTPKEKEIKHAGKCVEPVELQIQNTAQYGTVPRRSSTGSLPGIQYFTDHRFCAAFEMRAAAAQKLNKAKAKG